MLRAYYFNSMHESRSDDRHTLVDFKVLNSMLARPQYARFAKITEVLAAGSENRNMGPGHSKWVLLRHIRAHADANDIVVVVDGDDYLSRPDALAVIARRYAETHCWMT